MHRLVIALCAFVFSAVAFAESIQIPGIDGDAGQLNVRLPPAYDAKQSYSVLLSPGDYYWQDRDSVPGWIVVSGGAFYGGDVVGKSALAIAFLRKRFPPKGGGFHIAGWSANSAGVFAIAMAHADEFLSVTGIAGMPGSASDAELDKLKSLGVHFVVGENDTYWRDGSMRWHERMKSAGVSSTLEIIPNGGHVMDELVGPPIFDRLEGWMAAD